MDYFAANEVVRRASVAGCVAALLAATSCGGEESPAGGNGDAAGSGGGVARLGAGGLAGSPSSSGGAAQNLGGSVGGSFVAEGAGGVSAGGTSAGGTPGSGGNPAPGGMTGLGAGGAVAGAGGDSSGAGGSSEGAGGARDPGDFCLQAGSGDFNQDGPYDVATEDVSIGSSGLYTIWYPSNFESDCPHPLVVWGNGTTVTGSTVYAFFNARAVSWGAVAIGSHNSNVGDGSFHRAAIDYLLAQNDDPSSKYYQKLSGRVGVSGHSQGGFGASRASTHPNVEALVPVGASGSAGDLAYLCLTGTADIAPAACRTSVQAAQGPALAAIWEGGDHVVTQTLAGWVARDPGTLQMTRLYAAWFRCHLADDPVACGLFEGGNPSCTICTDPGWAEVITNNL